jgi:transposase
MICGLLTDEEWSVLEPLVQVGPSRGRPPRDHRLTLGARVLRSRALKL